MYSVRYNPFLPIAAGLIVVISSNKIILMMKASSFEHPSLIAIQAVILVFATIAIIMLLVRKHIVVTREVVQIRESCMRNLKEIRIEEIEEARWGVKESGTWTKGKQQFTVRMRSGEELHFFSLSWLLRKERNRFFDYLKSRGVRIVEQA